MNDKLFQRVKYLYDRRDQLGLDGPQKRAIELSYKSFYPQRCPSFSRRERKTQNINNDLTRLYLQFNRNLLASTNSFRTSCG